MPTAVYVGAGLDFTPLRLFEWIDRFIYIDSQPLTEFGSLEPCKEFSRPQFESTLIGVLRALGCVTRLPNSNLILLKLIDGRQVFYYINNCFPHIDASCKDLVGTASVLICCGHIPNPLILTYMKRGPKIFIGDTKTGYTWSDGDDDDELVKHIEHDSSLFEQYIKFASSYEEPAAQVTHHQSIQDLRG